MWAGAAGQAAGATKYVSSRIEAGNQDLTVRTLAKIAAVLHTTLII